MRARRVPACQGAGRFGPRASRGYTLVELMVSLVIGLFLLGGVLAVFLASRSTYKFDEALARIQENGRYSMNFLADDIRMAGSMGCISSHVPPVNIANIVLNPKASEILDPAGIRGYRYACSGACTGALTEWSPPLPADYFPAGGTPQQGSDVLIVQYVLRLGTHLTGNTVPSNANIQVQSAAPLTAQIAARDVLVVSDCQFADVFKATGVSSSSGKVTIAHATSNNTQSQLMHTYDDRAELSKLVSRSYYVAQGARGEPSLYRNELGNNGAMTVTELAEGVEVMRLLFGADTDGDKVANTYAEPGAVGDWRAVVGVRMGVVMRSPANVGQDPDTRTYDVLHDAMSTDDDFGPRNDTRRRWVFSSTIQLRNR